MCAAKVDFAFGPGTSPVMGAINATAFAAWTTMAAANADAHPLWALGAGVGMSAAAAITAAVKNMPTRAIVYRAATFLGAGIWSTYAVATAEHSDLIGTGPWSTTAIASLATLGGVGGMLGLGLARAEKRERTAAELAAEKARREALAAELAKHPRAEDVKIWQARLLKVTRKAVKIINFQTWDSGYGFTLEVELPDDGTEWRDINFHAGGLAASAKLNPGCGVEVLPGLNQGIVLIEVTEKDSLAEPRMYSSDHAHKTINNPVRIGRYRNGEDTLVNVREDVVLATGDTGSGKTTLMNDFIAEYLQCVDVVPMVIDFNGGGLALPWLLAWRMNLDKVHRPPIDWVASDEESALLLTEWLLDVVKDRKSAYVHVKFGDNVTLLPMSPDLPLYMLLIDEAAEILGPKKKSPIMRKVAENIGELQRIGRDSGGRMTLSSLSATKSTLGDREISSLAAVRIGQKVTKQAELAYLFDDYKVNPADSQHKGSGHIAIGNTGVRPYRADNLDPVRIEEVVIATADRRPGADERAENLPARELILPDPNDPREEIVFVISGETYRNRWNTPAARNLIDLLDQGVAALAAQRAGGPITAITATTATAGVTAPAPDTTGGTTVTATPKAPRPELPSALKDMDAAIARMKAVADKVEANRANRDIEKIEIQGDPNDPQIAALNELWTGPTYDTSHTPAPAQPAPPTTETTPPAKPARRKDPRIRALEILKEAGHDGMGAQDVSIQLRVEGYTTSRQTVTGWFKEEIAKGNVAQPGGDKTPYIHREAQ